MKTMKTKTKRVRRQETKEEFILCLVQRAAIHAQCAANMLRGHPLEPDAREAADKLFVIDFVLRHAANGGWGRKLRRRTGGPQG